MCKPVYFRASLDWLVIVKILLLVFLNGFLLSWHILVRYIVYISLISEWGC